MLKAEYRKDCLRRGGVEREAYAGVQSTNFWNGKKRGGANDLLESILERDNLNRAYKQVKRNHGAPGIDGMTVNEGLLWIKVNRDKLLQSIREDGYKPSPVRRKEIPKPDGGVRKVGIPTVIDRVIQQTIQKVKSHAKQGYVHAVEIDLSKYFDTLNYELLLNLLCYKFNSVTSSTRETMPNFL